MTAVTSQLTRRDSGLRRLRAANRVLAVAAIVLTLVLAELAAHAFHGHARRLAVRPTPLRSTPPTGSSAPTRRTSAKRDGEGSRTHQRPAIHKLRPPAQPPTTQADAPQPAATQPSATAPAPAASTTVSGGS